MVENTLTVGKISEGFVLDHIEAGKSMEIYKYLHLDKLDCCVAIIKNAKRYVCCLKKNSQILLIFLRHIILPN